MTQTKATKRRSRKAKVDVFATDTEINIAVSESDVEAGYAQMKDIKHERRLAKLEMKEKLRSRADLLANDFEFYRNRQIPCLNELYPSMPWKWSVDLFYPNAEGGPLWVDEPNSNEECNALRVREKFLRERGFRYVILDPLKTSVDDEVELSKCGQTKPLQ